MKNFIYIIVLAFAFGACSPDEYSMPKNITADDAQWTYENTGVVNEFNLINNTPGTSAVWDMGNGVSANGNKVVAQYSLAGTYTISLTLISQGGTVTVQEDITLTEDNPAFLSGYPYDQLIGDGSKTWAVDGYATGAFGLGPTLANPTEWHADGPGARKGKGLYDDRFTFSLTEAGLTVEQVTNGDVYANGGWAADLGDTEGNQEPDGGDFIMPYDGTTSTCVVAGTTLSTGTAFLGYYAGAMNYELITVTDDLLEVAFWDTNANFFWYTKLVPVDKLTEEPEAKPLEIISITTLLDAFEGNSSLTWLTDPVGSSTMFNAEAKDPVNNKNTVGKFTRSSDVYGNFGTNLTGKAIDFVNGSKVMMKVYIPSSNDYTPSGVVAGDWITIPDTDEEKMTLELKFQNDALGGNAWQTQMTLKTDVLKDYEDQWVTLIFDFSEKYAGSAHGDKDELGKFIIQYGGEGWAYANNIEAYFDDIQGMENSVATIKSASNNVIVIK
ncbi:PKD domain-containing protein [Labilibacter marinus]|uniref:PKD domain-containing protein n=1 Tax=Labilibacter marinus TaxID=1477105 RepID=UPI00094F72E3|nr:PKD domain-containing protein [Labilibacter marinus]